VYVQFSVKKIHRVNGITVTLLGYNNPHAVVVPKATWVEKWGGQGNWFNNFLIQVELAPWKNSWVHQQKYRPVKPLYAFRVSNRINTGDPNAYGSLIWQLVHHDLLLVEDLENLSSGMANRTHGMIMGWDAPHRVQRNLDISSVLTVTLLVPSSEDSQYVPKPVHIFGII